MLGRMGEGLIFDMSVEWVVASFDTFEAYSSH
jgi:hypothetical protein